MEKRIDDIAAKPHLQWEAQWMLWLGNDEYGKVVESDDNKMFVYALQRKPTGYAIVVANKNEGARMLEYRVFVCATVHSRCQR